MSAVGCCIVQECYKQLRARYKLEELVRKEEAAKERLAALKATEENVRSPAKLAALVRKYNLDLVVLRTAMPDGKGKSRLASARRPGEVLDVEFSRIERPNAIRLASAGER